MIAYISRRPLFAVVPAVIFAAYAFFDPGKPGWIWYFFLPGIACAIIKKHAPGRPPRVVRITLAAAAIPLLGLIFYLPGLYSTQQFVLTSGLFFCLFFAAPPLLCVRPLMILGTISYSIYLLQLLILYVVLHQAETALRPSQVLDGALMVATVVLFIPLCAATYKFIEVRGRLGVMRGWIPPNPTARGAEVRLRRR